MSVTVPVKDASPLAFWVVVDGTSNGGGVVNECIETNNTGAVADVTCGKL